MFINDDVVFDIVVVFNFVDFVVSSDDFFFCGFVREFGFNFVGVDLFVVVVDFFGSVGVDVVVLLVLDKFLVEVGGGEDGFDVFGVVVLGGVEVVIGGSGEIDGDFVEFGEGIVVR